MIGSDEVDPPHAQPIIINKEVVSLTSWLRHIILLPTVLSQHPASPIISSLFSNQNDCDSLWKFQSVQSQLI